MGSTWRKFDKWGCVALRFQRPLGCNPYWYDPPLPLAVWECTLSAIVLNGLDCGSIQTLPHVVDISSSSVGTYRMPLRRPMGNQALAVALPFFGHSLPLLHWEFRWTR